MKLPPEDKPLAGSIKSPTLDVTDSAMKSKVRHKPQAVPIKSPVLDVSDSVTG